MWQRWLIEYPARIVDAWFFTYKLLLAITGFVTLGMVLIVLVLAAFGVRWGW